MHWFRGCVSLLRGQGFAAVGVPVLPMEAKRLWFGLVG